MTTKEMVEKVWEVIFGNGRKGIRDDVTSLKMQVKFIILMNMGIIGLLIKLIFFGGK